MDIWYYVLKPFTWLLMLFYNIFGNYGMALIIFALIVKLILFPFSLKGKRSMIQMNMLQGKLSAIQKKYANDRERQNSEIQKLYDKEKVNPMGGCLWSIIPLFVLFPLYAIVRQPMKYVMGLSETEITTLMEVLGTYANGALQANNAYFQLQGADVLTQNLQAVLSNPAVADFVDKLQGLNFHFLGLNLANIPNVKFWLDGISWNSIGLFLIPLVSAATGFIFSLISMKTNAVNNQAQNNTAQSKMMLLMSPLMSLWIGFVMPGVLGIYWVANNVFSMIQEFICGKMLKKDYEAAAKAREDAERMEKEEEKERRRKAAEKKAQALSEAKTAKGKKKLKVEEKEKRKGDTAVISVSGVGTRAYARGRSYDPSRFSPEGPTEYRDPGAPIDENAVEKALEAKAKKRGKAALEAAADEMIVEEIMEEDGAPTIHPMGGQSEGESPEGGDAGMDVDDPWKTLDQEMQDIVDQPEEENSEGEEKP